MPELSNLPDDAIMDALARATADAAEAHALFDELFVRHVREAESFAWRMLRDTASAEEIVQEAFVRVWRLRARYHADPAPVDSGDEADHAPPAPGRRFLAWFYTILRNLARDALRRRPYQPKLLPPEAFADRPQAGSGSPNGQAHALAAERRRRVAHAVASLEPPLQEVIVLRLYEGLTLEQIGQRLAITPQAVRKRLSRAFEKLRPQLSDS